MKKLIFVLSAVFLVSSYIYPYPTEDSYELTGREYFPTVKRLLAEAKKSIYISMYLATYYPDYPKALSNQLLRELVRAKRRGVEVRVILDQGKVYSAKAQYNDLAYFYLKSAGISVDYDTPATKHHDKIVIIDESIVIIGSHNWTRSAIQENRESSVVIRSPELAQRFIEWIKSTPLSPRRIPPPDSKVPDIYLPYQFLTDPGLGEKLTDIRFKLYLYLLRKWRETGYKTIILDYDDTAKFIGLDKYTREVYRRGINRVLREFETRFKFISFRPVSKKPAEIDLLSYKDHNKPFIPEPRDCFIIPGAFWEFGWVQKLSSSGKYFYFIGLVETSLSTDPNGWWSHSQEHLHKKYHADFSVLSNGVMELNRYNLLAVEYGRLVYPFEKHLTAPRYRLLSLYSWEWHQKELAKLKKLYGIEKTEKAIQQASVVLEENNLEAIEKLINYSKEYGEEIVQYAVDKVSKKRIGNPKRSFIYIEGIILKYFRDLQEETED